MTNFELILLVLFLICISIVLYGLLREILNLQRYVLLGIEELKQSKNELNKLNQRIDDIYFYMKYGDTPTNNDYESGLSKLTKIEHEIKNKK